MVPSPGHAPYRIPQPEPSSIRLTETGLSRTEIRMGISGAASVLSTGLMFGIIALTSPRGLRSEVDPLSFALVFAALLGSPILAWRLTAAVPLTLCIEPAGLKAVHARSGAMLGIMQQASAHAVAGQWQGSGKMRSLMPLATVRIVGLLKTPIVLGCQDVRHAWMQEPDEGRPPDYWVDSNDWQSLVDALGLTDQARFDPERQDELMRRAQNVSMW